MKTKLEKYALIIIVMSVVENLDNLTGLLRDLNIEGYRLFKIFAECSAKC